jgi:hypothetical protein
MLPILLTINMLGQNNRIKPVSDKNCYETSTMTLKNLPYSIAHPHWLPSGDRPPKDTNAEQRITSVFLKLLERQSRLKVLSIHYHDRMIHEAKALLQHTNWSVAEIAYALGFEYPTYFNNLFKKKTGQICRSVRGVGNNFLIVTDSDFI